MSNNIKMQLLGLLRCFKNSGCAWPCPNHAVCSNTDICEAFSIIVKYGQQHPAHGQRPDLDEIAERMGAAAHELWMQKRKEEKGWHAPEDCDYVPEEAPHPAIGVPYRRGDCPKCHKCMRPYDQLPDSERELDRQYPRLFMDTLEKGGYRIVPADGDHDTEFDRNQLAMLAAGQALALGMKAGVGRVADHALVVIDLPTGQVSWCIPAEEMVADLPDYDGPLGNTSGRRRERMEKVLKGAMA